MNTDDLIKVMAADLPTRPTSVERSVSLAVLVSTPIAFGLLVYALHVRPDFWYSLGNPRFVFKFVFTLGMAGAGLWLAMRLSRPGQQAGSAILGLVAVLVMMALAVVFELVMVPPQSWLDKLFGTMAAPCVVLVPVLSIAPFIAIMIAMRAGAPDHPARAGAAAGLLASAIGATFYAPYCPNDSPLFVAVWYLIGIAAVTLAGSLVGSRVLRW